MEKLMHSSKLGCEKNPSKLLNNGTHTVKMKNKQHET